MTKTNKQTLHFLFGDRELIVNVSDLLLTSVDVIVNPANAALSHTGGVALKIIEKGGNTIQTESDLFIKEHGTLESGMVALTTAGSLPYRAILHAVGPKTDEKDEQRKIQLAVARCLQLCDMHDWKSIAFPAISAGGLGVSIEVVAQAFYRAITSYWDARMGDSAPEKVVICLTQRHFPFFLTAFREASMSQKDTVKKTLQTSEAATAIEPEAGVVNLSAEDISRLDKDDVNEWFT